MTKVKLVTQSDIKVLRREVKILRNQLGRNRKATHKIVARYYLWQNYFEEKKRRYKARFERQYTEMTALRRLYNKVKKLHILGVQGIDKNSKNKRYVVLLTHNNISRLRRFLESPHYYGREIRKGYGLIHITEEDKKTLMRTIRSET